MLRKLIELLPVSRRKYTEGLTAIAKIIEGLIEAEANHCQIETNIIQQLQQTKEGKPVAKKTNRSNDTNMYG